MDIEFKTKEELYHRVYPALSAKKAELKRLGYFNVQEKDIWNFLSYNVFSKMQGLTLADIVSEIMHLDEIILDNYIKKGNN